MVVKRLRKEDRRVQLLEVARGIVRQQGTEALTLGYLAERANVTKPIPYDHFGDREGLLMALYQDYSDAGGRQQNAGEDDPLFQRGLYRLCDCRRA